MRMQLYNTKIFHIRHKGKRKTRMKLLQIIHGERISKGKIFQGIRWRSIVTRMMDSVMGGAVTTIRNLKTTIFLKQNLSPKCQKR